MSHIQNLWQTDAVTNPNNRDDCCGCGACENKCPKSAIRMRYDNEGFLYPCVDAEKCIDCGLCQTVCPVINASGEVSPYIKTFAGYASDKELLMNCTSGGLITALSIHVLQIGGAVVGVQYSDDCVHTLYHIARTVDEVMQFSGSKYVQSEKNDVYKQVESELKKKIFVLFVGCPCDVQALHNFLGKNYENLICVEFICMGVSSYKIAEDYKKYVEKKYHDTLVKINARSKTKGWFVPHLEEWYGVSGQRRCSTLYGTYLGYGMQVFNRPSCFHCKFRGEHGSADIRVGDYWGIKETDAFWNPDGVSCIFVRTEKGMEALREIVKHGFRIFETDYATATESNRSSHANKSEKYVVLRNKFAKKYLSHGLIPACRATATPSFWARHLIPDQYHARIKKIMHKMVDKRK